MYLLYVDESGSPADPNLSYFVLAGFCIFERQGFWISQKLDEIAARFDAADPASVELHGSPMRQGRGNFWSTFPLPERVAAMEDALRTLAESHPSNRVFAVAVRPSEVAPEDVVSYAFEQLASRFDQYLMRLHRQRNTQRGIIIFDKTAYETSIQGLATNFRTEGHRWGVLRNLAEVPLFLDSKASRLIQLADLVAYGVLRHFDRGDSQLFDIFTHRIDREGQYQHGLHHR